ncbi:MAG: diguanylate cyclase, partial [Chloroflexota bacterium]|nr:diguanylate cyclase [Chloroflexota bacterium]
MSTRLESFFVPDELLSDGTVDDHAAQIRYRRMVGTIAGASVVFFVPSMAAAGVPTDLWPPYLAGVTVTAGVLVWSLLFLHPHSATAIVGAGISAVVLSGLAWLLHDYLHQVPLLYALVVAATTSIHGFRAALVLVVFGSVLLPLATVPDPVILTDTGYTFLYLLGVGTVPWIYVRLRTRGASALRVSAKRYRDLVESVPAVVYTADFGPDGTWRYVSPSAADLLGFPAEDWTADAGFWWSRIHPDDRDRVLAEERESFANPQGQRSRVEYRMTDRVGGVRWVRDEAVIVPGDEDGSDLHWSGFLIDITDRRELEEQLQHQAFHDPLTGLANRALFADRVEHALARTGRRANSVAVLFMDLDDFKTVNDGMGHGAGDELLVAVGDAVLASVRPMDTAARLGGDEFAILLEDEDDAGAAVAVAERILGALTKPIRIQGREVVIGASIGIARPLSGRDTAPDILRNADSAMYAAKRQGKGRHETFAPAMHAAAVERLELAGEMRRALDLGEYTVHYQPAVRLSDGMIVGFEALVRWRHPERGLILPAEFIPAAEETGHI